MSILEEKTVLQKENTTLKTRVSELQSMVIKLLKENRTLRDKCNDQEDTAALRNWVILVDSRKKLSLKNYAPVCL